MKQFLSQLFARLAKRKKVVAVIPELPPFIRTDTPIYDELYYEYRRRNPDFALDA